MTSNAYKQSYGERAKRHSNPAAKQLLETMERKKTNLCVSVDTVMASDFLAIIDAIGPYTCLVKTHIDILEDFEYSIIERLEALAKKHDFLIFEDRKFADIGNTVALQYSAGVHKIAKWSHITNAHPVPGPSIVRGLASVGLPLQRGLLLLAEMSTAGTLAKDTYTEEAVAGQGSDEDFLILTPGVGLEEKGDGMGQQYRTPHEVVLDSGCDVIIVGRGIYGKNLADVDAIAARAERYMTEGWAAYLKRISS
ncbi:humps family-domain-containing protein [Ephemerocybe angulata]|uniref:Orotidine 5'-phosphate decarboxylase n=1 Tax=Ephemerocybe angulata TaxID=980116 RepID=A0A8H6MFJ8_9AGAR|nr:humps family-domain-containing protein [Tulosesus angulatus]